MGQKKRNIVRGRTKDNKIIDLTKNKTSSTVSKYVSEVTKHYRKLLIDSDIPVFREFANDPKVVQNYFLNRYMNTTIVDERAVSLMDRAFRYAVSRAVTRDIMDALRDSKAAYPGIWPEEAIFSLVVSILNITTMTDKPDKGCFLVVSPSTSVPDTADDIDDMASSMCMPFSEYNPNRFYQVRTVLQNVVLKVIMKNVVDSSVNVMMHVADTPIYMRHAVGLCSIMHNAMDKVGLLNEEMMITGNVDEQACVFIEVIENPLIGYVTGMLSKSGLSGLVISEMFKYSTAEVMYDLGEDGDDATKFIDYGHTIRYILRYKGNTENDLSVVFTVDVMELYNMVKHSDAGGKIIDTKIFTKIGKELVSFFEKLMKYAIMIHMIEKDTTPTTGEAIETENVTEE